MKHIIIGGVAGGASAAARIRRIDEKAEIILIEKGKNISLANCGFPYYIGGLIDQREKLLVQSPQGFSDRYHIDIRVETEVLSIDPENQILSIRKPSGEIYTESYDKLLLAVGAKAFIPDVEGIYSDKIFTLRTLEDTDRIKGYIDSQNPKKAIIIGAGFIGIEMAENLQRQGIEVHIVEMNNQLMSPLDFSMASLLHPHVRKQGIKLHFKQKVVKYSSKGDKMELHLESGETMEADFVILSIGVRPYTDLAQSAGIKLGKSGGIEVNSFLQTSFDNIYAVGDVIEYPHPLSDQAWLNFLAGPANRQARIVADNMVFGNKTSYEGSIGSAIAKVFDMTVGLTGLSAKALDRLNMEYLSSTTHTASHASYYPGASLLSIKLTFEPKTGRLYGAQIVGFEGVDKRLDQLALLIKMKGSLTDLMALEHCYAPPYSTAKDAIAIAAYVGNNILENIMPVVYWLDIYQKNLDGIKLLDVRTPKEHSQGHIQGSLNIPLDSLRSRLNELDPDQKIYVYCAIGLRAYLATRILIQNGFKQVYCLSGGFKTYAVATKES